MRTILLFASFSFLTSCATGSKQPSDDLASYFTVQKNYVNVLDQQIGNTALSRVVPVVGAQLPIGTPMTSGTTSPITANCKVSDAAMILRTGFSPLPVSKSSRTFNLSAGVPVSMQKSLREALDLGIKFDSNSALEMTYSDLRQELLPEDSLSQLLNQKLCAEAVRGKTIVIIRGYVFGKAKISFGDNVDSSANAKFLKLGEYNIKYVGKSGFTVEDSTERPQFAVIAEFNMSSGAGQRQTPSAASTQAFSRPVVPASAIFR
jgi:hypothetical protein